MHRCLKRRAVLQIRDQAELGKEGRFADYLKIMAFPVGTSVVCCWLGFIDSLNLLVVWYDRGSGRTWR
ncbi:hypothetical protein CTKA_01046 [Chthonomonas calidirosea]|uniref:Uncharacterized protein n=1 Tax=Chthonomonas calidirosea (strain DSM 23976 / ICMP 18418 / T49) TaxID=1303518 RepID=S0ES46_CHTCT|nr:hypothetical protein CCALI_00112 [Chthonomonas calidirosea T49]CEK16192.1 hypothetical protein CTKA_01046 [Chthonomonas calidirosea]